MNVITYDVYKNTVKKHDGFNPVTSEKNYTKLQFRFQKGDAWEKCTLVTASFWLSLDNIVKSDVDLLSENLTATFDIPPEFSGVKGALKVGLQGKCSDDVIIATNIITLNRNNGVIVTEGANAVLYEKIISLVEQYFDNDKTQIETFISKVNADLLEKADKNETLKILEQKSDKSDVLSDEVNLLNITGISDKSNDYFIKTIENNTVTVTSAEGDNSVNMILTLDNGSISCKGTTGNRDLTIKLSADFERNGEYLFALQNQQSFALGYPRVYIGKQTSDYLIYGVNKTSYKSVNLSSEAYKIVFVTLPKNSSFYISFNISLTRSANMTQYLPYNVNPKLFVNRADYYNDTVYPHMFGAVGDGVTDDTAALQLAIDYAIVNKKSLKLSSGCTYLISNTLNFEGAYINFDGNGSTIKMSDNLPVMTKGADDDSKYKILYVIKVDNTVGLTQNSEYAESSYIRRSFGNVVIDCNFGTALTGLRIEHGGKTAFRDIMVIDPEVYGVRMLYSNEAVLSNIHCTQSRVVSVLNKYSSAGIYLSCDDCYVENCISIDFERGFATGGSDIHFSKCHAWNAHGLEKMAKSISFDVLGGYSTYNQCTVDSTKYGFCIHKNARILLNQCISAFNSIYKNNINTFGSPTLFMFDKGEDTPSEYLGGGVTVTSSLLKPINDSNIISNFDNLTDTDDKIFIDRLIPLYDSGNEILWKNAHINCVEDKILNL